jgi:anti-sigma B factor antagonist
MEFNIEALADKTTVRLQGKLNSKTAPELRALVKPLIPDGRLIVLDLSGVEYMDSSGLATLVGLYTSAVASANCKLQLIALSPRVRELLRITKLLRYVSRLESTYRTGDSKTSFRIERSR